MFIEPPTANITPRSRGAKRKPTRVPLPEHCAPLERRSALVTGVYKHLAPLEPEPLLGCGGSRVAYSVD